MSDRKPLVQDPVSALIREQEVRIVSVHAVRDANLLIVVLNKGRLEFPLSDFKLLAKASDSQLGNYELLPDGAGVHWPELDEDLSLRGFLLSAMRELLRGPGTQGPGPFVKAVA